MTAAQGNVQILNARDSIADDALLVNHRRPQYSGYLKKHLFYLFLLPILVFTPYFVYTHISIDPGKPRPSLPSWYYLSIYDWTTFIAINVVTFILISFIVRVIQDIAAQVTPRRHFYIFRIIRRSRIKIIFSLYLIAVLVILDIYTPSKCKPVTHRSEQVEYYYPRNRLLPTSFPVALFNKFFYFGNEEDQDSDNFEKENFGIFNNDDDDDDESGGHDSNCINGFLIAKKLIKSFLVALVGISISKVIVMIISILYQDKVYRDRILLNRYHLFVTQLLFSVCRFEGAKKGLLYSPAKVVPKRPASAFFSAQDVNADSFQVNNQDEDILVSDTETEGQNSESDHSYDSVDGDEELEGGYNEDVEMISRSYSSRQREAHLRPITVPVVQPRGLVRAMRNLFGVSNSSFYSGNNHSNHTHHRHLHQHRLLTEKDWVNFATFKKSVGVFGPDFSLMSNHPHSSNLEIGLSAAECKKRGKFVFDVLTYGKDSHVPKSTTTLSSSTSEQLIPSSSYSKDLQLPPVHLGDFQRLFTLKAAASEIYSVFDLNLDGNVTRSELKHVFVEVHQEARNLVQSVNSSVGALKALDLVLNITTFLILTLIIGLVWGANVSSVLTLTLSFILALNVIIGDWAKNAFDSLMFLFICHPFDIGDEISIEGDPRRYVVSRVYVLSSALRDSSGVEVFMPNPALLRKNITNWKRSNEQWELINLYLGGDTTEEQIYAFRARLTEFLKSHGKHLFHVKFEPDFTPMIGENLDILNLRFRIPCKLSLDMRRRVERHRLLQNYIRSDLEYLGITYYPRGPASTPYTFSKERSSFLKAFSKAVRKDPLLAEDAAGIAFTMNLMPGGPK